MHVKELRLERIPVHFTRAFTEPELEAILHRGEWDWHQCSITGLWKASFRSWIHGLPDDDILIHRSWPADWWQAFKDRWFPQWARRRWPVRREVLNVREKRFKAVCPYISDAKDNTPYLTWFVQNC